MGRVRGDYPPPSLLQRILACPKIGNTLNFVLVSLGRIYAWQYVCQPKPHLNYVNNGDLTN